MILDALLWLPIKVARHFLEPVTDMLDRLGEMTNEQIDDHFSK
jgi:hypothetical protein